LRENVRRSESICGLDTEVLQEDLAVLVQPTLVQPMQSNHGAWLSPQLADRKLRGDVRRCESRNNSLDGSSHLKAAIQLNLGMGQADLITHLKAGNQRYMRNVTKAKGGGNLQHRAKLASGQSPPVAIIGCADSRAPPELIFDADAGELFTIRVAGNVVNPDNLASLEYAVKCLGTKLVVILGHTRCGAVAAACGDQRGLAGHLPMLMHQIRPAIRNSKDPVLDNVKAQLEKLEASMGNFGNDVELHSVGAVFNIDSGEVKFLATTACV
jgi:carbonic anhydrase